VITPDLYRVNGSLPMLKSYHARGCGLNPRCCLRDSKTGFENLKTERRRAEIL
jgi:hypothetical protein